MLKFLAKVMIYFYKFVISPLLPNSCRFLPTCSSFSLEAIKKHGFFAGCLLTLIRLFSCHPFSKKEMHYPVPEKLPKILNRFCKKDKS
jgi:putative membrane protein insertion efficiency factor